jgi:hypothetical protein
MSKYSRIEGDMLSSMKQVAWFLSISKISITPVKRTKPRHTKETGIWRQSPSIHDHHSANNCCLSCLDPNHK